MTSPRAPRSVPVRRRAWVLLSCAALACGAPLVEPPPAPGPAAPPLASSSAAPVPPASAPPDPPRPEKRLVKAGARASFEHVLVSPDERWLVAPVDLPPAGPALLVHDLQTPAAPPRVVALGMTGAPMRFVSSARVLVHDVAAKAVLSVALDGSEPLRFGCITRPVPSPDGKALATVDPEGRVVLLSAETLAVEWRPDARPVGERDDVALSFPTPSHVAITRANGVTLLDRAAKRVVADVVLPSATEVRAVVSRGGKYVALVHAEDALVLRTVLVSVEDGKRTEWTQKAQSIPQVAFGGDAVLVSSAVPEEVTVVDLPSFRRRNVPTGLSLDNQAFSYFTGEIGVTDDGRFVCGHPVTSIGKYTDAARRVYVDLAHPASRARRGAKCFVRGQRAFVVDVPRGIERGGRQILATSSATYSRTSNELLSPDASLFGIATAKRSRDGERWVDAEMTLAKRATGAIAARFPIGSGPRAMGEMLFSEFSPSGAWLLVAFGETTTLFSVLGGERADGGGASFGELLWGPRETFVIRPDQDAFVVVALPSGAKRELFAAGPACLSGDALLPVAACAR